MREEFPPAPAEAGDVLIRIQIWASEVGVLSLAHALDQSRYQKVELNADWSAFYSRFKALELRLV